MEDAIRAARPSVRASERPSDRVTEPASERQPHDRGEKTRSESYAVRGEVKSCVISSRSVMVFLRRWKRSFPYRPGGRSQVRRVEKGGIAVALLSPRLL